MYGMNGNEVMGWFLLPPQKKWWTSEVELCNKSMLSPCRGTPARLWRSSWFQGLFTGKPQPWWCPPVISWSFGFPVKRCEGAAGAVILFAPPRLRGSLVAKLAEKYVKIPRDTYIWIYVYITMSLSRWSCFLWYQATVSHHFANSNSHLVVSSKWYGNPCVFTESTVWKWSTVILYQKKKRFHYRNSNVKRRT